MDDGKEINLDQSVGLKDQLIETQKNLDQTNQVLKNNTSQLHRLERDRKECKDTLDQITK